VEIKPRQAVVPIAYGKRTLELRLASRAECRDLIAEIVAVYEEVLPDDGLDVDGSTPGATVAEDAIDPLPDGEIIRVLAAMDMAQLRTIIRWAHRRAPLAVEGSIADARSDLEWARRADQAAGPGWACRECGGLQPGAEPGGVPSLCPECAANRAGGAGITLPDCARCGRPAEGHGAHDDCGAWRSVPGWAMDAPKPETLPADTDDIDGDVPLCAEIHPGGNYMCMLPKGHDGDHNVPSADDGSGDITWTDADAADRAAFADPDACGDAGPAGLTCTLAKGHDGPHKDATTGPLIANRWSDDTEGIRPLTFTATLYDPEPLS